MLSSRNRPRLLLTTTLVVALGLGSRHSSLPAVVHLYFGDMLWGSLFFLLGAMLAPRASPAVLGLGAVVTTEVIELSQLSQAKALLLARSSRLGGLLLGHQFLWSDVVCVALGAVLAAVLDHAHSSSWKRRASSAAGKARSVSMFRS